MTFLEGLLSRGQIVLDSKPPRNPACLRPVGRPPQVVTREDESGIIDPVYRPDSCVYAHCHELIDLLAEHGLRVAVDRLPARPVPLVK